MDTQGLSCPNSAKHDLAKQIIEAMHKSPGYANAPLENDFLLFYMIHKAGPDELYAYIYGLQDALFYASKQENALSSEELTKTLEATANTFFTVVQRDFPDTDMARYEALKNFQRGEPLS